MARAQPSGDPIDGLEQDGDVRLALLRQRRGEGDDDRVGVAKRVVVGRRRDAALGDERAELLGRHVLDVALAAVDRGDDVLGTSTSSTVFPDSREQARERHADVARADDGHVPVAGAGLGRLCFEFRLGHRAKRVQRASAIFGAALPSP